MKGAIVADDLTGANASGVLLKKLGLRVVSIMRPDISAEDDADVLALSTASRSLLPREAYDKVKEAFYLLGNTRDFYCKRVDSTLRGNVGAEIDAALDVLGKDWTAMIVPAYPDSGRIVVNGTMLVNGELLTCSDAGRDPKCPVQTNDVRSIVASQSQKSFAYVSLAEVSQGVEYLTRHLKALRQKTRVILFDAVRNIDIENIASAILASGGKVLTVDPGPLTMRYVYEMQVKKRKEQKILMVIGSVTTLTQEQIAYILGARKIFFIAMRAEELLSAKKRTVEIQRVAEKAREALQKEDLVMLTTAPVTGEQILNLQELASTLSLSLEEVSQLLASGLATTAADVLRQSDIEGVYCSGGDISVALLHALSADGIELRDEVMPLAVYGRMVGGELPGLKVVTKGGMIGGRDAIAACLDKMASNL